MQTRTKSILKAIDLVVSRGRKVSFAALARRFGLSKGSVRYIVKRYRPELVPTAARKRSRFFSPEFRGDSAEYYTDLHFRLVELGYDTTSLAKDLGVTTQTIRNWLNGSHLSPRVEAKVLAIVGMTKSARRTGVGPLGGGDRYEG